MLVVSSVPLISSGSTLKTLWFKRMILRHRLAQGDLLGTTGLVASPGPAAHRISATSCFGKEVASSQLQPQTQGNSSVGAGLALLMGQSKPAEVEAPEGCLRSEGDPTWDGGPHSLHGGTRDRPSPISGVEQPRTQGAGLSS